MNKRSRRSKEEQKEVRRIHQEEEEESLMVRMAGAPLDRVVLIAANEGDEGGCPVYETDKANIAKGCSPADADAAYIALVIFNGVVKDRCKDATVEEFPELPMNLTLDYTVGVSHGDEI